ncbi:MAG: hypothetical protein GX754_07905 [Clostridiaceae bacterium]|nr:hypothetical protein [Clostridiaceae bacterium]
MDYYGKELDLILEEGIRLMEKKNYAEAKNKFLQIFKAGSNFSSFEDLNSKIIIASKLKQTYRRTIADT